MIVCGCSEGERERVCVFSKGEVVKQSEQSGAGSASTKAHIIFRVEYYCEARIL